MIEATYLVKNTETGRVFYATDAMEDRATIRRLSEDESNAYLEKIAKETQEREAAQPKPKAPDLAQARVMLREALLREMRSLDNLEDLSTMEIARLAYGVTTNADELPPAGGGADTKRRRAKKEESDNAPIQPILESAGSDTGSSGADPSLS